MQGILPPPEGVIPDFSGGRSALQQQILVSYSALTAASALFLGLRLYTRTVISRNPSFDDLFLICSWLGCIAWLGVCIFGMISLFVHSE